MPEISGNSGSALTQACSSFRSSSVEPDQAFGQALRNLRTRRKWSQTELALRADVNRRHISEIELGRNTPGLRLIFKLCDALDVAPSDVIKDVEKRMRAQGGPR